MCPLPRVGAHLSRAGHTFPRATDALRAGVAAWSLAHGFATLLLSGNLSDALEGRDPEEAFRSLTGLIFAPENRRDG
ncbi:TetR-like C-terminal domain-containing protein [Streptomyces microflavus]|uniref:TetR-like C-terminal domain-containing protein n=1 Tax=Streptomyces microflavus TaxID=1919 RepID=UPI00339F429C